MLREILSTSTSIFSGDDQSDKKSSSSSSSSLGEPPCATLLNNNCNHYLHIVKGEDTLAQDAPGRTQPLQMTFKNPTENYFFMKWNWPLIRKISAWMFLSGMVAMLAVVIAMIWSLPKTCNPVTQWYQGNLMYEVFPASFADSNNDGVGDFKGLSLKIDYLEKLGVRILRLNSIFPSDNYPENYMNVTSLTSIAPQLGNMKDFAILTNNLHSKNISIIIDLPLWPFFSKLVSEDIHLEIHKKSNLSAPIKNLEVTSKDLVSEVIEFWLQANVDGFYLKGVENCIREKEFPLAIRQWKKLVGQDKVLVVNKHLLDAAPEKYHNTIYNNVDLIEVKIPVENIRGLKTFMSDIFNSTLFSKASMPWILWTLGDENTSRLADRLVNENGTLGATLLQLMLPGTPCIFYGDEIGLRQIQDPYKEKNDIQHLHQLGVMVWQQHERQFTRKDHLPWIHGIQTAIEWNQVDLIAKTVALRSQSPSIYINSINKDGVNKVNAEVKYADSDMLVIQRWYPRRKPYVILSNLGYNHIAPDLSKLLYSGQVIVGPRVDSKENTLSFKDISLWPGESVIIYVT